MTELYRNFEKSGEFPFKVAMGTVHLHFSISAVETGFSSFFCCLSKVGPFLLDPFSPSEVNNSE